MRLPRDLSGQDLIVLLRRRLGYEAVRQRSSHVRLTRIAGDKSHSITVPRHRSIRVGTLSGIIADIADHLGVSKDEVRGTLFGA